MQGTLSTIAQLGGKPVLRRLAILVLHPHRQKLISVLSENIKNVVVDD